MNRECAQNIQKNLPSKPEYVVTTSEFNDVKNRLMAMQNRRKPDDSKDAGRPTLRKSPGSGTPVEGEGDGKDKKKSDEDERPTLKRR